MKGGRFTAWFSDTERTALEARALEEGTPTNYVVRMAVRKYLGKDALKQAAEKVMDVSGNENEPANTP
jgi:hypothetical protein